MTLRWLTALVEAETGQFQTHPRQQPDYSAAIREDVQILERHSPDTRRYLQGQVGVLDQPKHRAHVLLDVTMSSVDGPLELREALMTVPLISAIYKLGLAQGRLEGERAADRDAS